MAGKIAIACATGGFKGVFLHGVLSSFEQAGFHADAYAAASSSVLPAAAAAVRQLEVFGLEYWLEGLDLLNQPGNGMSQVILNGLERYTPSILGELFGDEGPRFFIAASAVDRSVVGETQGRAARRRGRQLLLEAARGDRRWVEEHLTAHLFDTAAEDPDYLLTRGNFIEAAYASSRMLHAWDVPAWVAGRPFVDAFYTCTCSAEELLLLGYESVIALATEPTLYRDIFQTKLIGEGLQEPSLRMIKPDYDPGEAGVDYTSADPKGLEEVYKHGRVKGIAFLSRFF